MKISDSTTILSSAVLQSTWTTVCNYLVEKINNGDIEVLTFEEFYNSCIS